MNKLNLAAIALCTGITFACSPKASMVKGVICDATINTLTVVSEEGDTLSFSTLDAERVVTDGILLDDTAIVYHSGKYKTGMEAQKIVVVPGRRNIVGGDRDKHGCIGSAGYQWSEVQQRLHPCVRKEYPDESCRRQPVCFHRFQSGFHPSRTVLLFGR